MLHSHQAQAQLVLQEGLDTSSSGTVLGPGPCPQVGLHNRTEEESRAGAKQQSQTKWSSQARGC